MMNRPGQLAEEPEDRVLGRSVAFGSGARLSAGRSASVFTAYRVSWCPVGDHETDLDRLEGRPDLVPAPIAIARRPSRA